MSLASFGSRSSARLALGSKVGVERVGDGGRATRLQRGERGTEGDPDVLFRPILANGLQRKVRLDLSPFLGFTMTVRLVSIAVSVLVNSFDLIRFDSI